jgi:hypothetical protein
MLRFGNLRGASMMVWTKPLPQVRFILMTAAGDPAFLVVNAIVGGCSAWWRLVLFTEQEMIRWL